MHASAGLRASVLYSLLTASRTLPASVPTPPSGAVGTGAAGAPLAGPEDVSRRVRAAAAEAARTLEVEAVETRADETVRVVAEARALARAAIAAARSAMATEIERVRVLEEEVEEAEARLAAARAAVAAPPAVAEQVSQQAALKAVRDAEALRLAAVAAAEKAAAAGRAVKRMR